MVKHTEYYDLLGVDAKATPVELKKAYRKTALRLHPDRGGDPEQFKKMKAAYDVLNDPQKRKMYDKYGKEMVKLMDGEVGSPEAMMAALARISVRERAIMLFILLVVSGIVLLPAILVSLRWDSDHSWGWAVAFVPLWLFEGVALGIAVLCFEAPHPEEENEEDLDDEARAMHREAKSGLRRMQLLVAFVVVLLTALQIFVALRLDGTTSWSWYLVLVPWYILELFFVVWRIAGAPAAWVARCPEAVAKAAAGSEEPGRALRTRAFAAFVASEILWGTVRLITAVLIAARAQGSFNGSWFLTMIPLFLACGLKVLFAWLLGRKNQREYEGDPNDEAAPPGPIPSAVNACCGVGFWLIMVCCAAGKLDGGSYSGLVVFIPLFVVVGVMTCCFACSIACFNVSMLDPHGVDGEDGVSGPNTKTADESGNAEDEPMMPKTEKSDYGTVAAGDAATSAIPAPAPAPSDFDGVEAQV